MPPAKSQARRGEAGRMPRRTKKVPEKKFRFLCLPPEIRLMIYSMLAPSDFVDIAERIKYDDYRCIHDNDERGGRDRFRYDPSWESRLVYMDLDFKEKKHRHDCGPRVSKKLLSNPSLAGTGHMRTQTCTSSRNILLLCKQTYNEAISLFYKRKEFLLSSSRTSLYWMRIIGENHVDIQHISVFFNYENLKKSRVNVWYEAFMDLPALPCLKTISVYQVRSGTQSPWSLTLSPTDWAWYDSRRLVEAICEIRTLQKLVHIWVDNPNNPFSRTPDLQDQSILHPETVDGLPEDKRERFDMLWRHFKNNAPGVRTVSHDDPRCGLFLPGIMHC
ncbi:hypothetical protein F4779DRAFT_231712 [Xylariaceae sp. FL0662B]|nr:hypothetical protein F4779DRAFT_231712 [Xylariaceae sp. FL0662B]